MAVLHTDRMLLFLQQSAIIVLAASICIDFELCHVHLIGYRDHYWLVLQLQCEGCKVAIFKILDTLPCLCFWLCDLFFSFISTALLNKGIDYMLDVKG